MQLEGIDHVALSVRDIQQAAKWYVDILGFERRYADVWGEVPTFIGKGDTAIALFPAKDGANSPARGGVRMLHLAFRANRENFHAAQAELKRQGISIQFEDHQVAHSIYFSDPDGHQLEITTYEI
jgi:catechol 2,3-dioxygenase-like lactoylglutathione lyase family enzyme